MLLKIPPFLHLLLSCVYSLHKVEIKNKNAPTQVCEKIRFLKGLEDMSLNFLHKDREAIQMPVVGLLVLINDFQ